MIIYRLVKRASNPIVSGSPKKYYPALLTLNRSANLDYICEKIREQSSLPVGDIKAVLQNFVEKVKEQLLEGKTVNIAGLGVFMLSAQSKGADTEADFNDTLIDGVRICFMANKSLRLTRNSTRANEKLEFVNVVDYLKGLSGEIDLTADNAGDNNTETGGSQSGNSGEGGSSIEE